ncbi:MAG: reverse transcriptase domain-containing protein [Vicinamibacterales bacterium]
MPVALSARRPRRAFRVCESVTLDHVADIECLREGWKKVRTNKGGPGGDRVTLDTFGARIDVNLAAIKKELLEARYRPRRLRWVKVPKSDGTERQLKIPAVRDRVVQAALLIALAPTIDPRMSDASWAYRPGRGVQDALREVRAHLGAGRIWVLEADIQSYFDRVPHDRLVEELTIWLDDVRLISLVQLWLRSFSSSGTGIAQGAPISPLLANVYLHPVDRLLACDGFHVVRYADDLVIMTHDEREARSAMVALDRLLRLRGLALKAGKTRIVSPDKTFRFLGENICATS